MQVSSTKNSSQIIRTIVLIVVLVFAYFEQTTIWALPQNLHNLFSSKGIIGFGLSIFILLTGIRYLILGIWQPEQLQKQSQRFTTSMIARWGLSAGLLIIYAFIFLYSTWQTILSTPWLQFALSLGLAQTILWVVALNHKQSFGWSELALALTLFIYPRVVQETRELLTSTYAYRLITLAGFGMVALIVFALYSKQSEKIRAGLVSSRARLGWIRYPLIGLFCVAPILHRYVVAPDVYVVNANIRFAIWLITVLIAAYFASDGNSQLVRYEALGLCLGVSILAAYIARSLLLIIDYPFTMYWSEGDRFYDYSLMFAQSIYNHAGKIINPYSSPGRYGLWGILFLWQGLPIWAHRLWNLMLYTLPVLIFATLITRKLSPLAARYGMLLWITLFLIILTPLHPPFIVASIVMAVSAFDKSPVRRGLYTVAAGYYVAISRFTWAFAPGAIGLLIDLLLYYPNRSGKWIRRVLPAVLIAVLGILPGIYLNFGTFQSTAQGIVSNAFSNDAPPQADLPSQNSSLTSQQPLLWQRLLPNDTLKLGVLLQSLLDTLPAVIFLAWLLSKRRDLDLIQRLAIIIALTGLYLFGLVVSAKIGGGGDLHNLDMFIITLIVTLTLVWGTSPNLEIPQPASSWISSLAALSICLIAYSFTPFDPAARYYPSLDLPNAKDVNETLAIVQDAVKTYAAKGEVLFMDQRQLLTFDYIPAIPFIAEYEKKYMMDQAMGNNGNYFHDYYADLARQRFSLIITEPLRTSLKVNGVFPEENDVWVKWVSNPTLCYYDPIFVSKENRIELLIPKQNSTDCEQYLK